MLHADSFALGDSMSALEMMDPKMDAGLLNPSVVPAGSARCPALNLREHLRGCPLRPLRLPRVQRR
jgi:hypothetical protein